MNGDVTVYTSSLETPNQNSKLPAVTPLIAIVPVFELKYPGNRPDTLFFPPTSQGIQSFLLSLIH